MRKEDYAEKQRQVELALTQACYEADLAKRQYDAVDPDNRLVAAELPLERPARGGPPRGTSRRHRAHVCRMKRRNLWCSEPISPRRDPAAAETRRILRTVIEEIVVTLRIELLLHWHGGDHTRLSVRRNRTGQHRWSTAEEVGDLIRALARQLSDGGIPRC